MRRSLSVCWSVSYAVLYKLGSGADLALLFLPLPFLLWAAVRFGALGASTAISIVGFLAIWSASHGHGPFSGGTAEQNALSIQIFLIGLAIPLLFLAALIEERVTGADRVAAKASRVSKSSRMLRPFSSGWPAWTSSALSLTSRGWSLPDAAWNRSLETAGLKACTETICKECLRGLHRGIRCAAAIRYAIPVETKRWRVSLDIGSGRPTP